MKFRKITLFALSTIMLTSVFTACSGTQKKDGAEVSTKVSESTAKDEPKKAEEANKPDTWIADRHIVVRTFNGDFGEEAPADQINNAVAQKIKELTGMTMEIQYTPASSSLEALTTAFAAGNMPDAIIYYLNNSSRPEFPVVLKGAREGVLTDIAPYLRKGEIYSKYYDKSYMPEDAFNNIIQREEFAGGTYHVQMRIERELDSNDRKYRGGMWIQTSIKEALGINTWDIRTVEDLYNLAIKIKEGNFKDSFGNPVTPIGPSLWGGGNQIREELVSPIQIRNQLAYINDELIHELETDYAWKQVEFMRKLLAEGLLHKEAMTIESAKAQEGVRAYSYGIVSAMHNRVAPIVEGYEYLPINLENIEGKVVQYKSGKSGYGAWSIPSTTKNPEEIVKFADFMATKEAKYIWKYGIEGEDYTLDDKGFVVLTQKALDRLDGEARAIIDYNIEAGGRGSSWGRVFGETDLDDGADFGEVEYGTYTKPELIEHQMYLYTYGLDVKPYDETVYTEGFSFQSYIEKLEGSDELRTLMDTKNYNEMLVKAVFAQNETAAKAILDDYMNRLNRAKLQEFKTLLDGIYKESPKMVNIQNYKVK